MTRQRGFTLIEIVVAFVMLALVLGVSYELFSTGLRRAGDLEDYSKALAIAQSRIAEASYGETFVEGETSGDSDDGRYKWTLAISRYEENVDPAKATQQPYYDVRIGVRVAWRAADKDRHLDLATLVLGKVE